MLNNEFRTEKETTDAIMAVKSFANDELVQLINGIGHDEAPPFNIGKVVFIRRWSGVSYDDVTIFVYRCGKLIGTIEARDRTSFVMRTMIGNASVDTKSVDIGNTVSIGDDVMISVFGYFLYDQKTQDDKEPVPVPLDLFKRLISVANQECYPSLVKRGNAILEKLGKL